MPRSSQKTRLLLMSLVGVCLAALLALAWFMLAPRPREPVEDLLAAWNSGKAPHQFQVVNPLDGTLFPADIAAPTLSWNDKTQGVDRWWVAVQFEGSSKLLSAVVDHPSWKPDEDLWRLLKDLSKDRLATLTVMGIDSARPTEVVSGGSVTMRTSADEVGAPILYRDVPLPFIYAAQNPETIRWRLGSVSSNDMPPVVLKNLPVCGNCHSVSSDGRVLGMDVDYANDKASYAITTVEERTVLDRSRIISWNDYKREDGVRTYGLLSQVSPDGRYVASTVKDRSVFVPRNDLTYSQLFFPIRGLLGIYDRETKRFSVLPGADDPRFVQSNPSWSPDGKYLVFARAAAIRLAGEEKTEDALIPESLAADFLEGRRGMQFDLYRIPFNEGRGGQAVPVPGASHNGMSNFFPRISPDGRWLVFTMAKNFMLLQPDSQLYILPAEGGTPRKMTCNTPRMNSWHSWSPNSRWLVFSSKVEGTYTQLLLTHVDEAGQDTPPLILENFSLKSRAANIPEFVNIRPGELTTITERFLDDYNYHRRADEMVRVHGDFKSALKYYQGALALNPGNVDARTKMAYAYLMLDQKESAEKEYALAAKQGPENLHARLGLAFFYMRTHQLSRSIAEYESILAKWPDNSEAHRNLGVSLFEAGRPGDAEGHFRQSIRIGGPNRWTSHLNLGVILEEKGQIGEARQQYLAALQCDPTRVTDCLEIVQRLFATPNLAPQLTDLLERVIAVNPDCSPAYVMLAQMHLNAGNMNQALACAQKAHQLDPRAEWLKAKIDELKNIIQKRGKSPR